MLWVKLSWTDWYKSVSWAQISAQKHYYSWSAAASWKVTISVPLAVFTTNQMTTDVLISLQSVAIKLYPCLSSVFPSVFLMFICFPLLLTLSPQLIINFFHDSQLSRSVRMEVLTLSDYSRPGLVFTWTISHITRQR